MSNRPSYAQLEGLVGFLEENPGIARGFLRTTQAKLETKRKWATLSMTLNALGGATKNGQGWAKYWAEKKCSLKKQCAQLAASMRCTGGGIAHNLPSLSALDKRFVAIMGGQDFAIRDPTIAINPFPEARSTSPPPLMVTVDCDLPGPSYAVQATSITSDPSATPTPAPTPTPLQGTERRSPRRRRTTHRNPDMERFTRIEERRVEAEVTSAQALANIANALTLIAHAINELAGIT